MELFMSMYKKIRLSLLLFPLGRFKVIFVYLKLDKLCALYSNTIQSNEERRNM